MVTSLPYQIEINATDEISLPVRRKNRVLVYQPISLINNKANKYRLTYVNLVNVTSIGRPIPSDSQSVVYIKTKHLISLGLCSTKSSIGFLDQEARGSARSIGLVKQMRASNDESTAADEIADVAEDLGAVLRVRGDLATVLRWTKSALFI